MHKLYYYSFVHSSETNEYFYDLHIYSCTLNSLLYHMYSAQCVLLCLLSEVPLYVYQYQVFLWFAHQHYSYHVHWTYMYMYMYMYNVYYCVNYYCLLVHVYFRNFVILNLHIQDTLGPCILSFIKRLSSLWRLTMYFQEMKFFIWDIKPVHCTCNYGDFFLLYVSYIWRLIKRGSNVL